MPLVLARSPASSTSAIATSSIPSSASTLTRSPGSWLRSVPLARFVHGKPGRLERVRVRPAAGDDLPRLVAAGAQRPLGELDLRRARLAPVAGEHPLDGDVEVALGGVGGVLEVVDHRR